MDESLKWARLCDSSAIISGSIWNGKPDWGNNSPSSWSIIAARHLRGKRAAATFQSWRFEAVCELCLRECFSFSLASSHWMAQAAMYLSQGVIFFFCVGYIYFANASRFPGTIPLSCINLSREILACHDPGIYFVERLTPPQKTQSAAAIFQSALYFLPLLQSQEPKVLSGIFLPIYRSCADTLHHSPDLCLFSPRTSCSTYFISSSTTTFASLLSPESYIMG